MRKLMGAAVAGMLLLAPPAQATFWDGNQIYDSCQKGDSTFAMFYRAGVLDARRDRQLALCVPNGATMGQMVAMVCKWLGEHPEQRHLDGDVIAIMALKQGFGCTAG